jgi:hypothetical protein
VRHTDVISWLGLDSCRQGGLLFLHDIFLLGSFGRPSCDAKYMVTKDGFCVFMPFFSYIFTTSCRRSKEKATLVVTTLFTIQSCTIYRCIIMCFSLDPVVVDLSEPLTLINPD